MEIKKGFFDLDNTGKILYDLLYNYKKPYILYRKKEYSIRLI